MGPLSPNSLSSHLSPKPVIPNPNLNPFSALSPDLHDGRLLQGDEDDSLNEPLSSKSTAELIRRKAGPVIYYSRKRLLHIAKRCEFKGLKRPNGMGGLETWFGSSGQHLDDPAIASIGQASSNLGRRGAGIGYEEGFGYGGGIGGRGIGRGARNIGLRRPADAQLDTNGLPLSPENRRDAFGGQIGRFSARNPGDRNMRLGGDEAVKGKEPSERKGKRDDGEWRRAERGSAPPYVRNGDTSRRVQNGYNRFVVNEEAQIPAWMDDQQPSIEPGDSAIEKAVESDPLVKFIPGEDMIAVHKRAMKSRDTEGGWRGVEKPLSPFFDPDPVIASSSAAPGLPPGLPLPLAKTKVFNAADYLRPNKDQIDGDSEKEAIEHNINPNAFQSRFQRFFAGPSSIPSGPEGSGPPESNRSNSALDSQSMMMSPSIPPPRDVRSPPQRSPSEGEEHEPRRSDDRMATLMGLLSNKAAPLPPVRDDTSYPYFPTPALQPDQRIRPSQRAGLEAQRDDLSRLPAHVASPSHIMRVEDTRARATVESHDPRSYRGQPTVASHEYPPPNPVKYPHQHAHNELPSSQDAGHDRRIYPDPLSFFNQTSRQMLPQGHQTLPPGMFSRVPPNYRPTLPPHNQQTREEGNISPNDLLQEIQQNQTQAFSGPPRHGQSSSAYPPGRPIGPPPGLPGFLPPQFAFSSGQRPPPSHQSVPMYLTGVNQGQGPIHPQGFGPGPGPGHLGAAQQDMLATLFAGLGPRSGAGGGSAQT